MSARPAVMLAALLLPLSGAATQDRTVAGVEVPARTRVAGEELVLNGAGVRKKLFVKVYVAALYLPRPATSTAQVIAVDGPRRIAMHFVYKEVGAEKLAASWREGFEGNHNDAQMRELADRLARFSALFDTMRAGDVVLLDYVPERGTVVSIRGSEQAAIPGRDFNDALMRVWLGDRPADGGLRKALLAGG